MPELLLKFTDDYGEAKEILVEGDKFEIGRHSENDLTFTNSAVSRQHLKIELFSHIYTVTDVGSTLGTTLNGEQLDEPKVLKNGDVLKLGDSLKIQIVLDEDEENAENEKEDSADVAPKTSANASAASASSGKNDGGIPNSFFYLAPLFGLVVLLGVGGLFLFSGSAKTTETNEPENTDEFVYSTDRRKTPDDSFVADNSDSNDTITETSTPETNPTEETNNPPIETTTPEDSNPTNPSTPPKISDDLSKIEVSSRSF